MFSITWEFYAVIIFMNRILKIHTFILIEIYHIRIVDIIISIQLLNI